MLDIQGRGRRDRGKTVRTLYNFAFYKERRRQIHSRAPASGGYLEKRPSDANIKDS